MLHGHVLLATQVPHDVPVLIGRDEAARLARIELAKPLYATDEESLVARLLRWVIDRISDLLDRVSTTSPLGWFGLLGIALLVVVIIVVVRRRIGPLGRSAPDATLFDGVGRSADDYRVEATRYAASGAWAEAVRARLRAVVRDLEERGLIDVRPGRTADEIARDAGRALPAAAADLRIGSRIFDDVWYGGRPADAATYARLVAVDAAVAAARPDHAAAPDASAMAVPR